MKKIVFLLLLLPLVDMAAQNSTNQNGLQSTVISGVNASANQAKRYTVAELLYNSHHWQNSSVITVEAYATYPRSGYEKYTIEIGYNQGTQTSVPKIVHNDSKGIESNAMVVLGTPVDHTTTYAGYVNKVIPIYVDVRYYSQYKVKITHLRNKVTTLTQRNDIVINEIPVGVNIADFTAPPIVTEIDGDLTVKSGKIISLDQNNTNHAWLKYSTAVDKARFELYGYYGFRFADSGGNRMVIEQGGEVGIGTTTPASLLDVTSSSGKRMWFNRNDEASVSFVPNNGNSIFHMHHGHDNKLYFSHGSTVGGAKIMTIHNSGKVGIGTESPSARLDVISPNGSENSLRLGRLDNANYWGVNHAGNDFRLYNSASSGSDILFGVDPGGGIKNNKVGIGVALPETKLHVEDSYILSGGSGTTHGFRLKRDNLDDYDIRHLDGGLTIYNSTDARKELTFKGDGKIGVGTTNVGTGPAPAPNLKMQIDGDFTVESGHLISIDQNYFTHGYMKFDNTIAKARFRLHGYYGFRFDDNGGTRMIIEQGGNVGIGTTNPDGWKLAVNGKIRAKEVKVQTGWADFVFEENYDLPSLKEVEEHITEKGHLKDIPSAREVEENGILLGQMDSKLLQKIEELTLYTIQQEKKIQSLEQKVEKQADENESLKVVLRKLQELEKKIEQLKK